MKDFDVPRQARVEQDRGFKIGGETFVRRASVRPEATEPWEAVGNATEQLAPSEVLKAMDEVIVNLIEPGSKNEAHKRWVELRKREDDALNLGDMIDVITWLIEEQTARPTELPWPSSDNPEETGTSSTDGSSPPVLEEVPTG